MGLTIKYVDGQTPLNEEETEGLKISSLSTREELDEFEQQNIEKAIQWTFRLKLKPEQLFSEKFIRDLHKKMYGDVWKWAGKFRSSEKNIGVKSYHIAIELKQLLDDALYWFHNNTYSNEEISIRFKHRLVSIHCFPNGNGRHSRLIADLIMVKLYYLPYFSWGRENLFQQNDVRAQYIKALQQADLGNYNPLIDFALS